MKAPVCMTALGLILVGLVGCHGVADERDYTIRGDFQDVRVELSNGDLTIRAAEPGADAIEMRADVGGVGGGNAIERRMDGDTLVIDYRCGFCGGDVELIVPEQLPVDAWVKRGDLELDGLSAPVVAEVRTGAIQGYDLASDTEIFANAGGIELTYRERPARIDVESHVGGVVLEVPSGGYRLDTRGHLGAVRLVDVWDDASAEEEIRVFTHAGGVEILGNR